MECVNAALLENLSTIMIKFVWIVPLESVPMLKQTISAWIALSVDSPIKEVLLFVPRVQPEKLQNQRKDLIQFAFVAEEIEISSLQVLPLSAVRHVVLIFAQIMVAIAAHRVRKREDVQTIILLSLQEGLVRTSLVARHMVRSPFINAAKRWYNKLKIRVLPFARKPKSVLRLIGQILVKTYLVDCFLRSIRTTPIHTYL